MKQYIEMHLQDGRSVLFTPADIIKMFGISGTVADCSVILKQGKKSLIASTTINGEFGGITVDAKCKNEQYFLNLCELPCSEHNTIQEYLYAGNKNTEVDSPVGVMTFGKRKEGDCSRRMIFLDYDEIASAKLTRKIEKYKITEEEK